MVDYHAVVSWLRSDFFFLFFMRGRRNICVIVQRIGGVFLLSIYFPLSPSPHPPTPPRFCELSNACFSFLRLLCVVYWSSHPLYMSSNPVLCSTLVFSRRSLLSTNPGAALPHPPLTNTVYIPPGGEASSSLSFVLYDVCDVLSNARGRCFM